MEKFDVNEMAARLRELRARKNVTQKQVEDDTGISQSNISGFEQGRTLGGPDYETAWKLADYYGVPLSYLGGRTYCEREGTGESTGYATLAC